MKARFRSVVILFLTIVVLLLASTRLPADTGMCGGAMTTVPFMDVMGNIFFCQIAEAFFSGLTNGTSATNYRAFRVFQHSAPVYEAVTVLLDPRRPVQWPGTSGDPPLR